MTKRRSDDGGGGRPAKRLRKKHLYLAFDDWPSGYSIRKVTLPSGSDADDEGDRRRLVFRSVAQRGSPIYFAAAFGTKIMAMQPAMAPGSTQDDDEDPPLVPRHLVPVLDVRTRGIIFAPDITRSRRRIRHSSSNTTYTYIPVGDRLFALATGGGGGSLQMLYPPPLDEPGGDRCAWLWNDLPKPPMKKRVTSYAMHPDGRTLFVSTASRTFTLDTAEGSFEWRRRHGRWVLPFAGEAHFYAGLDAWVGLSRDTVGHLCSCDAVSGASYKLSKEKLFAEEDPAERHVGATLVYLGGGSKFCLVQCIVSVVDDQHLYRLTTFSLRYDKNGDLTTSDTVRSRYCKVPKQSTHSLLSNPVAFWL